MEQLKEERKFENFKKIRKAIQKSTQKIFIKRLEKKNIL